MDFLANLLAAERARRGTRGQTRSLSIREQAVLVPRWFLDSARMSQLARDNQIGKSTGYDYLHEGIDVLAGRAPGLHAALLAAKAAGYSHVSIDGLLIETDRVSTPGPTPGVDLWWSGKHDNHGGNVQVNHRPGRLADLDLGCTAGPRARHPLRYVPPRWPQRPSDLRSLGDLGYEGEADTITVAFKKPKQSTLTALQQQYNKAHNGIRAIGERDNALLKMTFRALRNVSLDRAASAESSPRPWFCCTSNTPAPHDKHPVINTLLTDGGRARSAADGHTPIPA